MVAFVSKESSSQPPAEWYCDRCRNVITDPNMSLVVWGVDDQLRDGGYLVVHKGRCDPGSRPEANGADAYGYSMDISMFLGPAGQAYLLSMLSAGPMHLSRGIEGIEPRDRHQYVDLFRRMQTPWYEQARRHFNCPPVVEDFGDVNELYPYIPRNLERIAGHGGACLVD
jgi:hypothetical protein